ncbi:hypothetical protein AURDEDRAFT_168126 [Auricularia subglabra TFB-10046 SS5]|nr:hypothetical protein AURDEDRAFT_168126 [Auricularia subglabra TFB-10046 SS5]
MPRPALRIDGEHRSTGATAHPRRLGSLPMLRELTIELIRKSRMDAVPALRKTVPPTRLDSITLWPDVVTPDIQDWLEVRLPKMMALLLDCAFPSIVIDVDFPEELRGCDLAALSAVTERVLLRDTALGITTALVLSDRSIGQQ